MFTVYVDDSGTAPDQSVAVAGVLIIPVKQITALDKEWENFKDKCGFSDLHASECAALNQKSYPGWDDPKVSRVFRRARQITEKYASKAFSFSVYKDEFDPVVPSEWRETGGDNHYTWGIRNLMHALVRWHRAHQISVPFDFVFDNAEGGDRLEIEMLMAQFESVCPGDFVDHYQFRRRKAVPALQCADLLAWTSYQISRGLRGGQSSSHAMDCARDYRRHQAGEWWEAQTFSQEDLKLVIAEDQKDPEKEKYRRAWHAAYMATKRGRQTRCTT